MKEFAVSSLLGDAWLPPWFVCVLDVVSNAFIGVWSPNICDIAFIVFQPFGSYARTFNLPAESNALMCTNSVFIIGELELCIVQAFA